VKDFQEFFAIRLQPGLHGAQSVQPLGDATMPVSVRA